jgi:hypothetical protein
MGGRTGQDRTGQDRTGHDSLHGIHGHQDVFLLRHKGVRDVDALHSQRNATLRPHAHSVHIRHPGHLLVGLEAWVEALEGGQHYPTRGRLIEVQAYVGVPLALREVREFIQHRRADRCTSKNIN